jgi:iron-sulfur cluster assembly protein
MNTTDQTIEVTPKALEKIREAFAREGVAEGRLRLGVVGGGCSGMSYSIRVDTRQRPNDHLFEFEGVRIVIDPKSMIYLKGLRLDYKESLIYSGFSFENPNAQRSCSCGTSFSA